MLADSASIRHAGQDEILPHRIRLRGPWQFDPITRCSTRRFHLPTGLTDATPVWLVIDDATADARLELNGQSLGEVHVGKAARFDITTFLKPRNLLAIWLTAPQPQAKSPSGSPVGLVSLEID